jgi:hypothetical protein
MQRRQITLEDGRYLIFYTFEDEAATAPSSTSEESAGVEKSSARREEPNAEPQATEERRV